MTGQHF